MSATWKRMAKRDRGEDVKGEEEPEEEGVQSGGGGEEDGKNEKSV